MAIWCCVKRCGACCHLEPSDRPDLGEYLSPDELEHYLSMVGEGGWCVNFDQTTRECQVYEQRPRFCRVQPDIFKHLYDIETEAFNDFAIDCCHQQIEGVYGKNSEEMQRYDRAIGK
jgi:Fe-S-cluster containining protein